MHKLGLVNASTVSAWIMAVTTEYLTQCVLVFLEFDANTPNVKAGMVSREPVY